jgi:exopolyphosphatase / guanosine-5'-triphosphate,3'-diphosphate pyrophosphatase
MSEPSPSQVVAVIDIGSSAVRMSVAEIDGKGGVRELEQLEQPLELGRDVFRRGHVRRKTLTRLLAVLSDFQRVLEVYEAVRVRAIGTSALREADNREAVLDQIHLRHGLDVELIGPAIEKRLLFLGVRDELAQTHQLDRGSCLIVEVGGGSTELTLLQQGEISATQTLPLGSVRLQEIVTADHGSPREVLRLRRRHVRQAVARVADSIPLDQVDLFVAVGGEVRFVAKQAHPDRPEGVGELTAAEFTRFVRSVRGRSPDRIARKLGMPWPKAEAFVPALLVYDYLLRQTGAEHIVVPAASLRTGILRELAAEFSGQGAGWLRDLVRTSAIHLGRRFQFDEQHALQVTSLTLSMFDQLEGVHGLGQRERLLLECAAILHDIGTFIHHKDHDRHGEYLLQASEVFGLGRREHGVVATVVRHHRVGIPGPEDAGFASLSRVERLLVLKLVGLLRLGDVLDRRAQAAVDTVRVERRSKRIRLHVEPAVDLYYERAAFPDKAALFEDIFGVPVELA